MHKRIIKTVKTLCLFTKFINSPYLTVLKFMSMGMSLFLHIFFFYMFKIRKCLFTLQIISYPEKIVKNKMPLETQTNAIPLAPCKMICINHIFVCYSSKSVIFSAIFSYFSLCLLSSLPPVLFSPYDGKQDIL